MKKTKKREVILGMLVLTMLFSATFVFAFSVGKPYMENNELHLFAGEAKDIEIILQNGGATENTNARASIIEGSEIIELIDSSDVFVVIPGVQTPVNFRITIPENAQIGDSYHIRLGFAAEAGAGSFSFGSEIEQSFDVIVGDKPAPAPAPEPEVEEESLIWLWVLIIAIILVVIIIVGVAAKKKKVN